MLNKLLDATVFYSFDKSGFLRHQKDFKKEAWRPGKNLRALITGASSGLGLATARELLKRGVTVHLCFRDEEKGKQTLEELEREFPTAKIEYSIFELSYPYQFPSFQNRFDIVVHNAGGMPLKKKEATENYEHIFSSQVIGPYILTRQLIEQNLLSPHARIIFVSSGGMYLKSLNLSDLNFQKSTYNPYGAYANAKRAQIDLAELFEEHFSGCYHFSAMHPGWADTPGVRSSLPDFWAFMNKRLRTPEQGADTIAWLAMTAANIPSGRFWFDRKEASSAWVPFTRTSPSEKEALWDLCEEEYKKRLKL